LKVSVPGPRAADDPVVPPGGARWIAVAGVTQGAGTTTLTALLSSVYAAHRRYRIVAVDANPLGGALGARLSVPGAATVADVAAAAPDLTSFKRLVPYLDQTTEGAWAVAGRAGTTPETAQCRDAIAALSTYFAVGVVDCGPIGQPIADALLFSVHARLLVAPVTVEGVLGAATALDWLGSRDGVLGQCGVVLVSTMQRPDTDVGWASRLLTGRGGRVIPMPYDPSLVAGGQISPTAVSDGVLGAVRRMATETLSRSARPRT
jgi:MinD-like ATPase involved in chromosome partitioning or flagellar assembly